MFETTRRHLFLAGFMGTGKSAIGREVAARLGWGFVDLDQLVVTLCHRSIPEIFEHEGEDAFRNYESRALRLAVISPHSVIALGGGTPMRRGNANIIRATGRTWLLTAKVEVIWARVRHETSQRPLLAGIAGASGPEGPTRDEFRGVIEPLMRAREEAYSRISDHVLDSSDKPIGDLADQILDEFTTSAISGVRS